MLMSNTVVRKTGKIGKRGTVVIPSFFRKRFQWNDGDILLMEEQEGGVFLRPAVALPVESYTDERKAEFLLSNAVDAEDYKETTEEVRKMGLDPDTIPHYKPE